ncbi:ADP-ribosylglycohydrolase family protein [Paenibacillus sp.]|uniref:ADP-ribosylglycohydrolase family protein n=1 Tax=Paenibacillus sp. TaxID=58172 RepID=UPI002D3DDC73|nr:ADP-ribosylglycohydrolase family protein [Paenibacillus sp.]HZG86429.1 ADP-ribosylglycohydrolase family protein [Paenibacillus sp.]
MSKPAELQDKFYGCIAGVHVGSAMGAQVEGWSWQKIEETYGTLDKLVSYQHYNNGWDREPGTTEDGVERQKLMITAIMEKQDRVNAEDVRAAWVKYIKPESAGMISEPFEAVLLAMAKSGIPARELGRYCDYAGLNSFSRSCHPIGLINAGDVTGAINDVFEVGQLYQTSNSRGLQWAAVTGAAIAEATKPNATVDSVIGVIYDHCHPDMVVKEIDRELKRTAHCTDFRELRSAFDPVYNVKGIKYSMSYANEVVTKAICLFKMTEGNLHDTLIAAVNMGRDTDCVAAVSAGIAGALSGSATMPEAYIKQVDYATSLHKVSNSQRTIREHADGLFQAYMARMHRMKAFAEQMAY